MDKYNFTEIEKKWQDKWIETKLNEVDLATAKNPFYNLMMFPYPSAEGLHVGNMYAFVHSDAYGRFMRLQGYDVFEPIGLDGFGIHSENYAIKIKEHIKDVSKRTEKHFYDQLHMIGNQYAWSQKVETYKPNYYKWTQWLFIQMYKKGLAYRASSGVNWCPSCKTVLSDEQVISGKCERCNSETEKRKMEQWFFKITDYAERLLKNLSWIDWSEEVKVGQKNWIGKSEGCEFDMYKSDDKNKKISVYTTRIDTVFGMTYVVIAPDFKGVYDFVTEENKQNCENYIVESKNKSDMDRTELAKEKTGVFTGSYVINPFNKIEIPVYIGDYVLGNYGTGAVMAVPAHDERDFEFAKKYNIEIIESIAPYIECSGISSPKKEGYEVNKINAATTIIKHWDEEKYLLLKFKNGEYGLVGGKIKDGEDKIDTIKREILEETGYTDFKIEKVLWNEIYGIGYKPRKDQVEEVNDMVFVVRLLTDKNIGISDKEKEKHTFEWFNKNEVLNKITTVEHHKFYWNSYLQDKTAFTEDGIVINSEQFSGLTSEEAREKMTKWLEKEGIGKATINYKLRDWCVSRQRYWGPPIPMIYCEKCGWQTVPEKDLPVLLPEVDNFLPDGTGKGPLNKVQDFVNTTCPSCNGPAKRETDVSDPFVDSCWYYLRYPCTEFNDVPFDKERLKKWMPVNMYIGGKEHTVLHLLYSRFITMVMHDIGYLNEEEPFKRFFAHGLLICEGAKMSKSKGNVINPDKYIEMYGADSVRMYLMFLGDVRLGGDWRDSSMAGMFKFINRVWNISGQILELKNRVTTDKEILKVMNLTIKKVGDDLNKLKFNTAIAYIMEYVNSLYEAINSKKEIGQDTIEILAKILAPFAPFITEEIWEKLGNKNSIHLESWPNYDEKLIVDKEITIVIQINGKVRDEIKVSPDIAEDEIKKISLEREGIKKWIEGKEIKKVIYVKGKLVSVVI